MKNIELSWDEQITHAVVDGNIILVADAVFVTAADMGLKYEGSFTGQSAFTINC